MYMHVIVARLNWGTSDARSNAPQLTSCNYFVGLWPSFIIILPYDHLHPSHSQHLPTKTLVAKHWPTNTCTHPYMWTPMSEYPWNPGILYASWDGSKVHNPIYMSLDVDPYVRVSVKSWYTLLSWDSPKVSPRTCPYVWTYFMKSWYMYTVHIPRWPHIYPWAMLAPDSSLGCPDGQDLDLEYVATSLHPMATFKPPWKKDKDMMYSCTLKQPWTSACASCNCIHHK